MSQEIYQLKIGLQGAKPPIWRRVAVTADTTLGALHMIIQCAMGWTNSHLHMFNMGGRDFSDPIFELDDAENENLYSLKKLGLEAGNTFFYEYDFGDSWSHAIVVEKVLPPDPKLITPVCLTAKMACPPEDVGGIWGYEEFVEALANPGHESHQMFTEWLGGKKWDATFVDLEGINKLLQKLFKSKGKRA